ncbi:MAG TPA: DUF1440 domain-containing protein [Gemmatimonadaceae bacterium]|nr:DUF1440 domain-containing protein [Gemmatimonadaceae bacterium]
MPQKASVTRELVTGAVAGAIATWVMGKTTTYLYQHEDPAARAREDSARHGTTAYAVAAEKLAHAVGARLDGKQRAAGSVIHWALGAGAAALFALLRGRTEGAGREAGLVFGSAVWLLMDEGAVYALGLTPGPAEFPWQTHVRGLVGHLVYGAVTDATLNVLDRVV